MIPRLTELRLTSFKSVRDSRLALGPLILVVGRNGSGKSNVLDALNVLAAISTGATLRDALDGGREESLVRGGSEGCAPVGESSFSIGCSAATALGTLHLDLEIQVTPTVQIVREDLWSESSRGQVKHWIASAPPDPDSADITVRWENGKRGVNPPVGMRADQLLTSQVAVRVPVTSQAGRVVHERAELMLAALGGIFVLDPVPQQMREYVPARDSVLRTRADNLSAVLGRIMGEAAQRSELLEMTRHLSESQVADLATVSSQLGDVMVAITERIGGADRPIPARLMSDGTLRFLAVAAAMLDTAPRESESQRLLVVEELENGLHPSQVALLVERLKGTVGRRPFATLATTHSPAVLDVLRGEDHEYVAVVTRDAEGWSRITRLVDFPNYFQVVGRATLGQQAVKDALRPGPEREPGAAERSLAAIFGA